jgi:hypothetical protein
VVYDFFGRFQLPFLGLTVHLPIWFKAVPVKNQAATEVAAQSETDTVPDLSKRKHLVSFAKLLRAGCQIQRPGCSSP